MATLTIGLDERTCKDGSYPVRFRLFVNNTSAYIYTGVYANKEEFTGDKYAPFSRRAYMGLERGELISRIARKYDQVIFDLHYNGMLETITANELREYLVEKKEVARKTIKKASRPASDYMAFFHEYSDTRRTANAVKHYHYIASVINLYMADRGITSLSFADIDYNLLVDMKTWIRASGRGEATRFKMESYVKAAYRAGARKYKISRDLDPYIDYKIEKVPEADIEVVEPDVIRRLIELDLSALPGVDSLERTRDILLASFCMGGANLIDLYQMMPAKNNEVSFIRHKVELKTKRRVFIRVSPELSKIIKRNKGKNKLFYWSERYESFSSFQSKTNERCRLLSRLLGEKINMELIRRSFSTIAGDLEVNDHVIDKLMGHTDQTVLHKNYKRFNWQIANNENDRVISFVFRGTKKNRIKVTQPSRA